MVLERRALLALVVLVFAEHLLLGAANPSVALLFAGCQAGGLLFYLSNAKGRRALSHLRFDPLMLGAFGLVIFLGLASAAPGIGWAMEPHLALTDTVKLCGLACLFVSAALALNSRRRARQLFALLLRGSLVYLGLVLALYAAAPTHLYGVEKFTAASRFTASFISANTAGTLSAAFMLIGVTLLIRRIQKTAADTPSCNFWRDFLVRGWPDALALLAAMTALLLTGSRSASAIGLVLLIGLLALAAKDADSGWRKLRSLIYWILLAGVLILIANVGGLGARFARVATDAPLRGELLRVHWNAFAQSPLLGHGAGAFEPLNRAAVTPDNLELLPTVGAVHNVYLQWLEQSGVVGAGAMAICLALVLKAIAMASRRRWTRRWTGLILAISALFLMHGFTDYALEIPSMSAFWTLLLGAGFGLNATRRSRRRRSTAPAEAAQ